jgi:hypothetical protein
VKCQPYIQAKYPHWSRTEGRDHVFIFPTERGPSLLSEANLLRIKKSIFVTGVVDRDSHGFSSWKDIVIPPVRVEDVMGIDKNIAGNAAGAGADASARKTLLHFRGVVPGHGDRAAWGIRNKLQLSLEGQPGVVFATEAMAAAAGGGGGDADAASVPVAGAPAGCGRECALAEMRESQYCLAPGGVEGWSLRVFDAVAAGCVPVLMSDRSELPYEGQLDWSRFSVKAAESSQGEGVNLVRRLQQASAGGGGGTDAKRAALEVARRKLTWHARWQAGDAFDGLLHELQLKLRFHRNSPYRFYAANEANG